MVQDDGWQQASIHAAIFGLLLTFALAVTFRQGGASQADDDDSTKIQSTQIVVQRFWQLAQNKELWKTSLI